jgi:methionyl-tRNA formyltransferase
MLAPIRPDLIISGGFPWRIPPEVIDLPRLGAINMHPSLLPRHRGPNSVGWAFRAGDPEMGFTVHRLDADFDTGRILVQVPIPIDDDDDTDAFHAKLGPLIPQLLGAALERVARGEPGEEQDETRATYAGLFEDEWRTIDWSRPARTIHNQVRSWVGFRDIPAGAMGQVGSDTLLIIRTRLVPDHAPATPVAAPGTLLSPHGETMLVQCGDGPLEIVAWSPAPGA